MNQWESRGTIEMQANLSHWLINEKGQILQCLKSKLNQFDSKFWGNQLDKGTCKWTETPRSTPTLPQKCSGFFSSLVHYTYSFTPHPVRNTHFLGTLLFPLQYFSKRYAEQVHHLPSKTINKNLPFFPWVWEQGQRPVLPVYHWSTAVSQHYTMLQDGVPTACGSPPTDAAKTNPQNSCCWKISCELKLKYDILVLFSFHFSLVLLKIPNKFED